MSGTNICCVLWALVGPYCQSKLLIQLIAFLGEYAKVHGILLGSGFILAA